MEPESSELPKDFVLYRGGYVHIRHKGSTPLGDVGSNNPALKGPTSSSAHFRPWIGSDTKLSHPDWNRGVVAIT